MHKASYRTYLLMLTLAIGTVFMPRGALGAEQYSFGVLNQQPAAETAALWNPIFQYVESKTGVSFRMQMAATVQETDAMSARGEFDFLYSNHIFDPDYSHAGYKPFAQWGGKPLAGQILVRAESPFKNIKDLQHKRVAFPSRDAFAAFKVTRGALSQAGVLVNPVFAASQQGVVAQLQTNSVDAISVSKQFGDKLLQTEGKDKYRILYESKSWPNIPVSAHPRIAAADVSKVKEALLKMSSDPDGKAVLDKVKAPGFLPVSDKEYDETRELYKKE